MNKLQQIGLICTGLLVLAAVLMVPRTPAFDDHHVVEQNVDQALAESNADHNAKSVARGREPLTSAEQEHAAATDQDSTSHPIWLIESAQNRVYLMGSVHVLRESDYPLPQIFQHAYDDAENLVMELGIDDIGDISNFAYMRRIAMLPDEQTLADYLGQDLYDNLSKDLAEQNIKLAMFDKVEPWYAAMTITQILMQRLGYKATHGIEMHFVTQALADQKPAQGLETAIQQFDMLDGLSKDTQLKFLEASVLSIEELATDGENLISAWKVGDIAKLEAMFADDMDDTPELEQALLTERNQRWLPKIEALTKASENSLVIVGALHLVGDQGVIELLRKRGFTVTQL